MSTQAASTRPVNRPMQETPTRARQDMPDRAAMEETRQMPMMHDGFRERAPGTETKQAFLTTEFWVYAAAVAVVVVVSYWHGSITSGLKITNPNLSWWYITVLTAAYLFSRGLSKAGSTRRSFAERRAARRQ
ncbi:hypothetical protein [Micromonospora sp. CB01531]|uniref:hypothetical protein n=1 Tax=Micromonospora sp. CB01531 TaxID=1718947 RepID=UPI000939A1ED|nr:hypothetical protein [Micromonospora sp. CB01531]OKI61891.1 hypothetical protein A6A27_27365 [Micromonospora sp. CB01531]